jgi:hypothetical protein
VNAGLSNLTTLKAWLLTAALQTATDYDTQIAAIGLGVAGQIEAHCHRQFARTVGDVFECTADRPHLVLPRYPVEEFTSIEQRDADGSWVTLEADTIQSSAPDRGLYYFGVRTLGDRLARIRATYTGGYFWEQLEPADDGYPTAAPSGSVALPAALLLAWRLQCEHVWSQRDKLGLQLAVKPDAVPPLSALRLLDVVVEQLRPFIRYSLF